MAWYYYKDKQCLGPFTEERVLELVNEGAIDASTPMRTDAMADWLPMDQAMQHFGESGRQRVAASNVEPERFSNPELSPTELLTPYLLVLLRGGLAAVAMSWVWARVVVNAGYPVPYLVLAVGGVVGLAVRLGGDPFSLHFRLMACAMTAASIFLGNMQVVIWSYARTHSESFGSALSELGLSGVMDRMGAYTSGIDLILYLVAMGVAYYMASKVSWMKKKR